MPGHFRGGFVGLGDAGGLALQFDDGRAVDGSIQQDHDQGASPRSSAQSLRSDSQSPRRRIRPLQVASFRYTEAMQKLINR